MIYIITGDEEFLIKEKSKELIDNLNQESQLNVDHINGANINFIAFGSRYLRDDNLGLDGQLISLFVIVLAAAEAAVALAIALNFYNNHSTVDVDRADELKG